MEYKYCYSCMNSYDVLTAFYKLQKCVKCQKYFCGSCIIKYRHKMMKFWIFSICNNCITD